MPHGRPPPPARPCLTPPQGNIWTLLLFRRRYGPSVGGMVVPLGSGKYFIAEHRLQQACPYYLLGSLLGAKVRGAEHQ